MNRYATLHATSDLTVRRFDHPPHEPHEDPDVERATGWSVAFVRDGSFDVEIDGERHRLRPGSVLITRPGLVFRCAHADRCPADVCHSIGFDAMAVAGFEHAWTRAGWAARVDPTPRLAAVDRRLARAAAVQDTFELERWSLAALAALAADSADERARGHYAVPRATLDAVTAVAVDIERDPAARRDIAARARTVGLTGAQLTHGFRRLLGVSPHRYVLRHRLVLATVLLDEGRSVSAASLDAGFENLSHFCRSFLRVLSVRPSGWRTLPPAERRRKVQALLRGAA